MVKYDWLGSEWLFQNLYARDDEPNLHCRPSFGVVMGGGGTAPKMKMSDALILTGVTILLGALFMQAWVTPVEHSSESPPYVNGATMWKGDAFEIGITVSNETTVDLVLKDEYGAIISEEEIVLAADDTAKRTLEITESGYYTYEINTKGVPATLDLDIERKYSIDMLPFPIGAIILAFGLYQRESDVEEEDEILDAELDI